VIVLDASVVVLGLVGDGTARRHLIHDPMAAPHLIDAEVAQTLRRQVLRRVLTADDGHRLLRRWSRAGVRRFPSVGFVDRIWELRNSVSAYDAIYVALAEALDCPLLTADARLAAATGPRCTITVVRR
jgi:predicted nucleic acid-binding protein